MHSVRTQYRVAGARGLIEMSDGVFDAQAYVVPAPETRTWYLFLSLISLATLMPFAAAPLVAHVIPSDSPAIGAYAILSFLGANFHVALTGWFYTDREMRAHFRAKPVRYIVAPCIVVSANVVAFCFFDAAVGPYIVFIFICWLLWHYQKQNVGLLSFIAAGTDRVPLSVWERRTLAVSAISGILGSFSVIQFGPAKLSYLFAHLHQLGAVLYVALVPVFFCVAVANNPILRTNRLRFLFFLIGTLFFLPTYIFSDPVSAVGGYTLAHGLQYFVFMSFVSAGEHSRIVSFAKLFIIAAIGGLFLNHASDAAAWLTVPYSSALFGLFIGIVMTHFLLDAGIWRLREPFQRGYMRRKFDFVFDR
jgi:hypothetical protein